MLFVSARKYRALGVENELLRSEIARLRDEIYELNKPPVAPPALPVKTYKIRTATQQYYSIEADSHYMKWDTYYFKKQGEIIVEIHEKVLSIEIRPLEEQN